MSFNSDTWASDPGKMPWIETSRKVIEFYNRGNIAGFDQAGYFVMNGVRVYETGKRAEFVTRDLRSETQVTFGNKY